MPPRPIHLTADEVAVIRRSLLHVEHQAEDLASGAQPTEVIISRLGEAVANIEYLLERAEARRAMH